MRPFRRRTAQSATTPDGLAAEAPPLPPAAVTARRGLRVRVLAAPDTPLAGDVDALPDAEGLRAEGAHGPLHVDAVLLDEQDPAGPWERSRLHGIVREAGDARVPTFGYRESELRPTAWPAEVVELGPGVASGPWPRPVVDTARINPIGFRRAVEPTVSLGAIEPGEQYDAARGQLDEVTRTARLQITEVAGARGSRTHETRAALVRRLHPLAGVLDHPDLHASPAAHATWLVTLCAAGVPVVPTVVADPVARHLGDGLVRALADADIAMLGNLDDRERLSVRQRSAALREHGAHHAWAAIEDAAGISPTSPPSISVLLATNRPEHLDHAAAQYEQLAYPSKELVAVLHGDAFLGDAEARLHAAVSTPVTVLRAPADLLLGEVMNLASDAASGQLITKLDDDDLYDAHHLDDLVEALRYSGATLVGKGSEFVYLAEIDTTIRRMPNGAETGSRSVAGGTLLMARDDLPRIGRWQRVPRFIDQLLIDDVLRAGGRLHRTHGHGFVLNRHGRGHTWDSSVDRFLQHAVTQWPGLALAEAGFADTSRTLP